MARDLTAAARRLVEIVDRAKGDDLERVEHHYGRMTDEQLNQRYGPGMKTRRQVLEECRRDRRDWQEARDLLAMLLDRLA